MSFFTTYWFLVNPPPSVIYYNSEEGKQQNPTPSKKEYYMISTRGLTLESAWQKRFGFGYATVDVVAYNAEGIVILKDPIGIHFVREERDRRITVLGYNVCKKTLKSFLDRFEGKEKDDHWVIRRPQDIGLRSGDRINGRVYKAMPTTLSTLYPGSLYPEEG